MTPENIQLMYLLKAHILESDSVETVPDADPRKLIAVAVRQNILSMIGDKLPALTDGDPEYAEELRSLHLSMMKQIYIVSKRMNRAMTMLEKMKEIGIRAVVLKGCAARELYPVPEWRTMGDIDALIAPEDMEKARELFIAEGYEVKGSIKRELVCEKEKNIEWEIKCSLEAEFKDSYPKWDKRYYGEAEPWKHGQYAPTPTLLLQHIIVHTAKNLLHIGAGVRNLCDIALCVKKLPDIDYGLIRKTCAEEDCIKIYNTLMSCVRYWFGVDVSAAGAEIVSDSSVEAVTDYMLSETIYGKRNGDNRLMNWTLRDDDEISPWRKIFFPSVKLMKMPYPYLKKYPFLLPAAWVQRGYDAIVKQKIPIGQMVRGAKKSVDFSREHDEYLKRLGLK